MRTQSLQSERALISIQTVGSCRSSKWSVTEAKRRLATVSILYAGLIATRLELFAKRNNVGETMSQHYCVRALFISVSLDCPPGWFLYANHCYNVSPYVLMSMRVGGCDPMNRVSINSPHEQAFVLSLLAGVRDDVFIGLERDDDVRWTNGEPLRFAVINLVIVF